MKHIIHLPAWFLLHGSSRKALRSLVSWTTAPTLLLMLGQGELHAQYQQPDSGQMQSYAQPPDSGSYSQPYAQPSYQSPAPEYPQQNYGPPPQATQQPLMADQLEQLVAPIALYPDTLVALVMTAATYPAQVTDADHWRQAQGNADPDQIVGGANMQQWDPSVKALTAFPQVLAMMDQNLSWTTQLGNAYYNQPQDLLQAVQILRQRAQAAGTLQSTPQETVNYSQGYIQLAPVNPQVVYVPAYNPWTVYGAPVAPYPGFSLLGAIGSFFGSAFGGGGSPISFGAGILMSAFSQTPWGWLGWGLNWLANTIFFNHSDYFTHSNSVADWGLPHGGPRAFYGRYSGYHDWNRQGYGSWNRGNHYYARGGYNSGYGYRPQPVRNTFPEVRRTEGYGNYQSGRMNNYSRPQTQSYRQPYGREQNSMPYSRPAYSYGSYGSRNGFYNSRPSSGYGNRMQAYRGSAPTFSHSDFGGRSSGFASKGFSNYSRPKYSSGGGFHLFGGGHSSEKFHAPKMSSHGGGHSGGFHFGGGHSGGGHHH